MHSYIFLLKEYNKYGSVLPYVFFRGYIVSVNDAVAKRVIGLLAEKKMTQYRLEQLSGIQHGHMQWIMSGKSKTVPPQSGWQYLPLLRRACAPLHG